MSEHIPTNPNAPRPGATNAVRKLSCEEWEALLVDFLDGVLPAGEAAGFDAHRQSCTACGEMFAQASQGREWLNFLRAEPQPPRDLIIRILSQTSGAEAHSGVGGDMLPASAAMVPAVAGAPFWRDSSMAIATRRFAQPRMLMTTAMAFFSITLTLNMAGVRLTAIRLADLKPAALQTNLNKQYHMASARVVRYYDNWRFLYEMEARVRDLRRDADLDNSAPVDKQEQPAPSGSSQDGNRKNGGKSQAPSAPEHTRALVWGERIEAGLRSPWNEAGPLSAGRASVDRQFSESSTEIPDGRAADQAERGIA
jgi:hypothetical protein